MPYANGDVPYSIVSVVLDSGYDENGYWEFRCTPAFAARWFAAKRYAEAHFGRTIYIRTGWNIYRPLFSQRIARTNACNSGNCAGAAAVGYSSHGGNWGGRDCLAVDVNQNGLSWAQVDEAMTSAGFAAGLITESMSGIRGGEPWHYILFGDNAFGPVPAGLDATLFPTIDPALLRRQKENDGMYIKGATNSDVYKTFTDANGVERMRHCSPGEAAFANAGGLVIAGDDATLTMIGIELQYRKPFSPTVSADVTFTPEQLVTIASHIEPGMTADQVKEAVKAGMESVVGSIGFTAK